MKRIRLTLPALLLLLLASLPGGPAALEAQPRPARVGFLRVGDAPASFMDGLRDGLRAAGHVEGQNLTIEYALVRTAGQLSEAAADLVRRKVDVIVASGTPSVVPARDVSRSVPVVFVAAIDPVAAGVVASLGRPGGNVTGVTAVHADVTGKRLALLKELLPRATRVAFLVRAASPATPQYVKEAEQAARTLDLQLQVVAVREPGELDGALRVVHGVQGLLVVDDAALTAHRALIAEVALRHRLPTVYGFRDMVTAGGFMAYGPDYGEMYRRGAALVHRILTGARPAELPVEQPTKFELVLNLRTGRALGLTIPSSLLVRADHLID